MIVIQFMEGTLVRLSSLKLLNLILGSATFLCKC